MAHSTRRPASHERSIAACRSRLNPAWVDATSSAGTSTPPVGRLVISVRGLRLGDREFCAWSLAIRMLRMLAGQARSAFTRIGRCRCEAGTSRPVRVAIGRARSSDAPITNRPRWRQSALRSRAPVSQLSRSANDPRPTVIGKVLVAFSQ